jgi:hypothetical protein
MVTRFQNAATVIERYLFKLKRNTYSLGWNLDTDLFNGFSELIWLNGTIVVQVKVLERLHEDSFLGL